MALTPPPNSPLFSSLNVKHAKALCADEIERICGQLLEVDPYVLQQQQALILKDPELKSRSFSPLSRYSTSGSADGYSRGRSAIQKGELACLVVAGGQGSRLGFSGPKGAFPLTKQGKSLFQLLAEKTLAAGLHLHLGVMTSMHNDEQTRRFFAEHKNFGLVPEQLSFFAQGHLPFLDDDGRLFLDELGNIAEGPNGNGVALFHLVKSGVWAKWWDAGVRFVNFIQVDNALSDPFDAELLAFTQEGDYDLVIKCIERQDPEEKVGVIVRSNEGIRVVEYSEIGEEEGAAFAADGHLKHRLANISQFCFRMDFVERVGRAGYDVLPLHRAYKATGFWGQKERRMAWKFEAFIFDVLEQAERVGVLAYPREQCYAPLKDAKGPFGPEGVLAALGLCKESSGEN